MWSVFESFKPLIKGKGYTKGFVPCNSKGTNDFRNRSALAYLINLYPPKDIVNFFAGYGVEVNQDLYALSELLQWIWRSRIRDGRTITLYLPSLRMRELLYDWYKGNL